MRKALSLSCLVVLKPPPHDVTRNRAADSTPRRINCTEYKYLISRISPPRRPYATTLQPLVGESESKTKWHSPAICGGVLFILILNKRSSKHTNYSLSNLRQTNRSPRINAKQHERKRRAEYINPPPSIGIEDKSVIRGFDIRLRNIVWRGEEPFDNNYNNSQTEWEELKQLSFVHSKSSRV